MNRPERPATFLLVAILALFLPAFGIASEAADSPGGAQSAFSTTKEELLLFWDEKDLYVETATRTVKPISQAAENMTVITARDIHDMNARSVAEALSRVPGLFVDFNGMDFSDISLLHIQGSESRHVTVFLDGVLWNSLGGGEVDVFTIPVQIIERIEVIKGPASSAWGSALGGVINIITKNAGDSATPQGTLAGSYGEANSRDLRAELYGRGGGVGYYLYAGQQASDGLRNKRRYGQEDLYAKVAASPTRDMDLHFTVGYSNPRTHTGDVPEFNIRGESRITTFFVTGAVDYRISREWRLKASALTFRQKVDVSNNFLTPEELLRASVWDEETVGGSLRLVYAKGEHTAVVGTDVSHGTMDQTIHAGPRYQAAGQPATTFVSPGIDKWALYANDTIVVDRFAVTPGIRLDHNNISGYFVSPSIGATYSPAERTVARISIARGFALPGLSNTSAGGIFLLPNPSLTAESGWSYQAGIETGINDSLYLKATVFRHDTTNEIVLDASERLAKIFRNAGDVTRQGYEIEAETVPVRNISLKAGHAYVRKESDSVPGATVNYSYLVGIKYDDRKSFIAQLMGSYLWWNLPADQAAKYSAFIWDLALNREIHATERTTVEAFLTVHNLFNGSYYTLGIQPNPGRWVDGGIRFRF